MINRSLFVVAADVDALFIMVEAQLSTSGLMPLSVAKDIGCEVVFVTNDVDRYAKLSNFPAVFDSAVSAVVDGDTNSVAGIVRAVSPLLAGDRQKALYTHCDYNLPLVAEAARKLGLPGLRPEAAAIARDKLRTREVCAEAGVPMPRFVHATTEHEARAAVRHVGLPCVVKPMTESASTGVALAFTEEEAVELYRGIAGQPRDARGQMRRVGALIEEYAVGYEVSVETITYEGTTHLLGVTDKALSAAPYFAELGDSFPSALPDDVTAQLARTALDALEAVGHDFGAAHTEVRMTHEGPKLIEINARIGGESIADLVEHSTGIRYREHVVRMHLGQVPDVVPVRKSAAACRYLMAREAGVVERVHGIELARRIPGVVRIEVKPTAGSTVRLPTSNHDLLGHVLVAGDTPAEASRRADAALAQIHLSMRPAS